MRPGERVGAAAVDQAHQLVIGGMELHDVHAVAEAVMGAQLRQMPVRLARQMLHVRAAHQRAGLMQRVARPVGAEHPGGLGQRPVAGISVVAFEGAGLVQHLVRRVSVHVFPPTAARLHGAGCT